MILTYKIKHGRDFSNELSKARKIAKYAVQTRSITSKDVKHIGLKSVISNQILRKYGRDKKTKKITNVKLIIPNQGIRVDTTKQEIYIPSLKQVWYYQFPNTFNKINQIEIGDDMMFVSVSLPNKKETPIDSFIGVDLNITKHIAVVGNPKTGKVWKLGKKAEHIHKKYKNMRRNLQKKGKYKQVKEIRNRESRVIRDLNHKISKKIIDIASDNISGIKVENLRGIRGNRKHSKSFRYSLNSWSFYQLQQMIDYKAKLQGIRISYIEPAYTSKLCSLCGSMGHRKGKSFKCPSCGHVDNADVNASFNIALRQEGTYQFNADRDVLKGSTDTPEEATSRVRKTLKSSIL